MVFASGIHLNTIMCENDVEYGEFVSLVKNTIRKLQEPSNINSNIDKDAFLGFFFPKLIIN
jgi:hypothetical protein